MAYVVTEPCIGTKDRSCVEVCPVDCFYDNPDSGLNGKFKKEPKEAGDVGMLVIDPDECISCGACEPECPVGAIFDEVDVPQQSKEFVEHAVKVMGKVSDSERDKLRVTSK